MSDRFRSEIASIRDEVVHMGWFAHGMLGDAVSAMIHQDKNLAQVVRGHKRELAQFHDHLEDRIFSTIALYQPVASDMRMLVCSLTVVTSSERIGRYGKDIANIVISGNSRNTVLGNTANIFSIPPMTENVLSMIGDALTAYETGDITLIKDLSRRDDLVDAQRHSIFRESITYMMEDPRTITACSHSIMVARYLERCGDHACGIAEKVHYMVTGERVEIK